MLRVMYRSKIHDATVTETQLEYAGSITVAADLLAGERVQVVNLSSGSRIETYVIEAPAGSGNICLNGPAARTAQVGDRVHILSYALMTEEEARAAALNVVHVDASNQPVSR